MTGVPIAPVPEALILVTRMGVGFATNFAFTQITRRSLAFARLTVVVVKPVPPVETKALFELNDVVAALAGLTGAKAPVATNAMMATPVALRPHTRRQGPTPCRCGPTLPRRR